MTIRELISASGMTQKTFSDHLSIPLRTIESWCANNVSSSRQCPEYVIDLIRFRLTAEGIIKK